MQNISVYLQKVTTNQYFEMKGNQLRVDGEIPCEKFLCLKTFYSDIELDNY